jgi:SAM-dependent methyltransferase
VLPYAEGSFDAVLSHDVVPYSEAPLALFAELHRVVRPGGTLCVTFSAPPPKQPASDGSPSASPSPSPSGGKESGVVLSAVGSSEWAKYATCDPRSASLAWLQAADGADLLYMVGSFFFYSAEWAELEVSELVPASAAAPAPVYAVQATKLTNRQLFVAKARRDLARNAAFVARDEAAAKAAEEALTDEATDVMQALAMALAVRTAMLHAPYAVGQQLAVDLAGTALAAAGECQRDPGIVGNA